MSSLRGIGVGLIGSGYMGKCHALAWNAVAPTFGDVARPRLVMQADATAELSAKKAAEFGFAQSTGDWRDLIGHPDIDVISIAAPNAFHAPMAIAALEAGKHVWCEKPMATALADARAMRDAARAAGRVAVLGFNYIQNPLVRQMAALIARGDIGIVNHVRIEMDEDFMADAAAPFGLRSEKTSGFGALDDFGVHPLSLLSVLAPPVAAVMADMAKPYASRPVPGGPARAVENHDIANVLLRLEGGASGALLLNRAAWGRKGRIAVQIFGAKGTIAFDQERFNEFQIYRAEGPAAEQGFTTILAAPSHPPYDKFIPAPGHSLGFNDLKVIECHELLGLLAGKAAHIIDFERGFVLEAAIDAMARSFAEARWIPLTP